MAGWVGAGPFCCGRGPSRGILLWETEGQATSCPATPSPTSTSRLGMHVAGREPSGVCEKHRHVRLFFGPCRPLDRHSTLKANPFPHRNVLANNDYTAVNALMGAAGRFAIGHTRLSIACGKDLSHEESLSHETDQLVIAVPL